MSAIDLRGREARVDRSLSPREPRKGRARVTAWSLWIAPFVLLPLLPFGSDVDSGAATAPEIGQPIRAMLPLDVNERVEEWLERFQTTDRQEFTHLLERSGAYAEMIRGKLRARGMPEELLYLAMIESGLSPRAVSQVSAVGMWQFMSPTALQYGLRVDQYVDERRDPVRATDAALDYLEWLHHRFGSWYLAAAAYNAGPGRVESVLRRHADGRTGDEDLYWEVLEHLPRETRDYVPRLVAATILAEDAGTFGFAASSAAPYRFEQVFVPGGTSLARVAKAIGIDVSVLRDLNPHLIRGITPPGEIYGVRVPVGSAGQVVSSLAGATTAAAVRAD